MKYNIVCDDGEQSSVTVFIGSEQFLATKHHPSFDAIVKAVSTGSKTEDEIRGLFDVSIPVAKKFAHLSERVSVNNGRIFFDMMPVDNSIAQAILRFHAEGNDNFQPLVNFMEKVEINPNPHSREHLFRWLDKHNFGIARDGDIIAYKGVKNGDFSVNAGKGVVNGELVNGHLANKPGTIIEMPRDEVTFDPSKGCSQGLHVGNWSYANSFGPVVLSVKVNPRDVVSVPTDSSDQKMRVCRYKVIARVTQEDKSILFTGNTEQTAKVVQKVIPIELQKPAKHKPVHKPVTEFPEFYEDFKARHFDACTVKELRWLAGEWEMQLPSKATKEVLVRLFTLEARRRKRAGK